MSPSTPHRTTSPSAPTKTDAARAEAVQRRVLGYSIAAAVVLGAVGYWVFAEWNEGPRIIEDDHAAAPAPATDDTTSPAQPAAGTAATPAETAAPANARTPPPR